MTILHPTIAFSNAIYTILKRDISSANDRENIICGHYYQQVKSKRMDTVTAIQRAASDIAGNNYHPQRGQRLVIAHTHEAE
jgi:hypothetical protein